MAAHFSAGVRLRQMTKASSSTADELTKQLAGRIGRRERSSKDAMLALGVSMIQSVLSSDDAPVLGLYVYMTYLKLMKSVARGKYRGIVPSLIGVPALLSLRPGLSQVELAELLGGERATVGVYAKLCLERGLIKREVSPDDRRRYALYLTPKGARELRKTAQLIPSHEDEFFKGLTHDERRTLLSLLEKVLKS
jgi:DNA-binding MarR family transcriptional regulator